MLAEQWKARKWRLRVGAQDEMIFGYQAGAFRIFNNHRSIRGKELSSKTKTDNMGLGRFKALDKETTCGAALATIIDGTLLRSF